MPCKKPFTAGGKPLTAEQVEEILCELERIFGDANENQLIDAEKFYQDLHNAGGCDAPKGSWADGWDKAIDEVIRLLNNQPTVDAVDVVRCKDCKSWQQYNACDGTKPHRCMNHDAIFYKRTAPDDFCSYGERRSE